MKMCEEYAALLDAFVDGELSPEETAHVREHLAGCPACAAYVADAMAIRSWFPDLEDTEVPEGLADGVMAVIRVDAAPRRHSRSWVKTVISLAACAAVVFAVWRVAPLGGSMSAGVGTAAAGAGAAEQRSVEMGGASAAGGGEKETSHDTENPEDPREKTDSPSAPQVGTSLTMSGAGGFSTKEDDAAEADAGGQAPVPAGQDAATGSGLSAAPFTVDGGTTALDDASAGEAAAREAEFQGRALSTGADPASYDERLADLDGYVKAVIDSGETGIDFKTEGHTEDGSSIAWYGQLYGTSHVNQYALYLYFADGAVAALPLPLTTPVSSAPPTSMGFDGRVFVYEIVFEEEAANTMPETGFCHVKGTYRYTVDLNAKTVSLEIRQ